MPFVPPVPVNRAICSSRDDFEVLEAVKAGEWAWPEGVNVSSMANSFVANLLVVDPSARLTAEQALTHPWLVEVSFKYTRSSFFTLENSLLVIHVDLFILRFDV